MDKPTWVLMVVIGFGLSACWRVQSKAAVAGSYELVSGSKKIILELKSDDTYEESVMFGGIVTDRRTGTWRWGGKFVDFDSLWIPKQFAPDYILDADASAGPGEPKYTEPGHWSLGAEKHFGRTVLCVFEDVNFTMVKPAPK